MSQCRWRRARHENWIVFSLERHDESRLAAMMKVFMVYNFNFIFYNSQCSLIGFWVNFCLSRFLVNVFNLHPIVLRLTRIMTTAISMLIVSKCYSEFLYRVFLSSVALEIEDAIDDGIGAAIRTCEEIQDLLQQNVGTQRSMLVDEKPLQTFFGTKLWSETTVNLSGDKEDKVQE